MAPNDLDISLSLARIEIELFDLSEALNDLDISHCLFMMGGQRRLPAGIPCEQRDSGVFVVKRVSFAAARL